MGVDASVRCRCWEQGTIPAELQPHVRLDDGDHLEFTLPYAGNEALERRYYEWIAHGCPHPEMELASEHVSSWGGYRQFQQALREAGPDRFPVLLRELPDANGGRTDADAARIMLGELDDFCSAPPFGTRIVLLDSDTGSEIHESIEAYDGEFVIGPDGFRMGVDRDGFFIIRTTPLLFGLAWQRRLFRSLRFTQHVHDRERTERGERAPVTYRDLDSGQAYTCESPVSEGPIPWPDGKLQNEAGKLCFRYPDRLHVEQRIRGPDQYSYITRALKVLCAASIESGNPIRWS